MKSFSERIGKTPIKSIVQTKSIDDRLRTALWNALTFHYWVKFDTNKTIEQYSTDCQILIIDIWINFFERRYDQMPKYFDDIIPVIEEFFFSTEWYKVYDFVEFIPKHYILKYEENLLNQSFYNYSNNVLEKELSAYRFVNGSLISISAEEEIQSIENAIEINDKYMAVKTHLETAIKYFSNRESPDYRNSIKESISAVESYFAILSDNPNITLGQGLKIIEDGGNFIHPALKKAFSNLYGYTSNEGGIRHGLLDKDNSKQEDAKFMLVVCSAFINYLKQKEIRIKDINRDE